MSFNDHAAQHLADLEKKRRDLRSEQLGMTHDCDCTYCDIDEVEDQERYDELEKELTEVDETIKRLKRYAELHKIPLDKKEKVAA